MANEEMFLMNDRSHTQVAMFRFGQVGYRVLDGGYISVKAEIEPQYVARVKEFFVGWKQLDNGHPGFVVITDDAGAAIEAVNSGVKGICAGIETALEQGLIYNPDGFGWEDAICEHVSKSETVQGVPGPQRLFDWIVRG